MTKMALLVPAAAVFALIFALASAEVAAQGIPVTPADSTIAVGQTMQFRATGIDTARGIEAGFKDPASIPPEALKPGPFTSAPSSRTPPCVAGGKTITASSATA